MHIIITKFYYQWYTTAPTIVTALLRFVIDYLYPAIIMPLVPFFTLGDKGTCMTIGSLRIDDFRTMPPLGHVIVLRCRPVEI